MGLIVLFSLLFFASDVFSGERIDHSKWDHILKQYVHGGLVDYKDLLQGRQELDDYLSGIEAVSAERLADASREERIAFWINLYNASVVRMVLDEYPIQRFDEIPAAFDVRTIQTMGEFFNLSELRDRVLRQGFRDERILIALVSGRMDSPRLLGEAFRGEKLEEQLNQVAHEFAEDMSANPIKPGEKKIFISPLFNHFGTDFLLNFGSPDTSSNFSEIQRAVISFLLHHLRDPEKRLFLNSARYQIHYLPEDPRLNEVQNSPSLKNGP